jgi:ATP-dependent protease Clp ATPase subunit
MINFNSERPLIIVGPRGCGKGIFAKGVANMIGNSVIVEETSDLHRTIGYWYKFECAKKLIVCVNELNGDYESVDIITMDYI